MGIALVSATMTGPVNAESVTSKPADDYVACLVGRAAVALHAQGNKKDSAAAMGEAYKRCKEPKGLGENEAEGIRDYFNMMLISMAGENGVGKADCQKASKVSPKSDLARPK